MPIYRGVGGSASTTEYALTSQISVDVALALQYAQQAEASATSAQASATSATSSAASASSSQSSASFYANSTQSLYNQFDARYLGDKTSDPTVDNLGGTLLAGAMYFNSTSGELKVYSGSVWTAVNSEGVLLNYTLSDGSPSGSVTVQQGFELEQTKTVYGGNY